MAVSIISLYAANPVQSAMKGARLTLMLTGVPWANRLKVEASERAGF